MMPLHQPVCFSYKGKRDNNEDYIYPDDGDATTADTLFLVCDGMGGHAKGEVASKIACDVFSKEINNDPDGAQQKIIAAATEKTLAALSVYVKQNAASKGMGTTLTLLWLQNNKAILAHIGDSRIYHLKNNQIHFKTKDHSLVQKMVTDGLITDEEARVHPKKNVITKALLADGESYDADIYITGIVEAGDYFFLCTDGVIESVDDNTLNEIFLSSVSNQEKMDTIEKICAVNSKDNYSAYLIQIA